MNRTLIASLTLVMTACAAPEVPPPVAPAPPPVPAPEPVAIAPAPTPEPPAPPPPPIEFAEVVEGDCEGLGMAVLDDGPTLWRSGVKRSKGALDTATFTFSRLGTDGLFHDDPARSRGLSPAFAFVGIDSLVGRWDDKVYVSIAQHKGRAGTIDHVFEWARDRWREKKSPAGLAYVGGSSLLIDPPTSVPRFHVAPQGKAPTPSFAGLSLPKSKDCSFMMSASLARPTGEVFVAGSVCDDDMSAALLTWSPKTGASRLPSDPDWIVDNFERILDGGSAGVLAMGMGRSRANEKASSALLAWRFDGNAWTREEVPFDSLPDQVQAEPNGTIWATDQGVLYRRDPSGQWSRELEVASVAFHGGEPRWVVTKEGTDLAEHMKDGSWRPVALPSMGQDKDGHFRVFTIAIDARGEPWVEASYQSKGIPLHSENGRMAILRHTTPGTPQAPAPSWCPASQNVALGMWPAPADEACTTPLLLIARIAKNAPANVAFPKVQKVLEASGLASPDALVEVSLAGERTLAARFPTMDAAEKVMPSVAEVVPDSAPVIACTSATVTRVLAPPKVEQTGVSKAKEGA